MAGDAGDASKHLKFPWDYDVPNDAFWKSLEYTVARNFLQCYTEAEISKMHFDETLSLPEKFQCLRCYLDSSFYRKEKEAAPTPLHDANYQLWMQFKLAMSTMEYFLNNHEEQEKIVREMYENGLDGGKNMSALENTKRRERWRRKFCLGCRDMSCSGEMLPRHWVVLGFWLRVSGSRRGIRREGNAWIGMGCWLGQ